MDGTPQVGLLLPTREAAICGEPPVREIVGLGAFAERVGFDSVWAGDSLLARPRMDPLHILSAVAAVTESVTLGTAVYLPALRHPVLVAHAAATVDQLAEGRLLLGVGAGFGYPATEAEFAAVDAPFGQRVGRMVEAVDICRRLWRAPPGDPVDFEGRYWSLSGVDLAPKPHRPGGPPIWLAGAAPAALRRAGSLFDGWLPYPPSPPQFVDGLAQVNAAAGKAGRLSTDVTAAMYVTIALDEDGERARQGLERYVEAYYGFPLEVMSQLQGFYGGDASGCADWMGGFIESGVEHIIIRLGTLSGTTAAAERVAGELLPKLAAASTASQPG